MRRMFSEKQLKEMADVRVQEVVSSGSLTNVKIFDEIVDDEGHKRFIEGNGVDNTLEGKTLTYCKWALSGSHLQLVCAGTFDNGTTIPSYHVLCGFTLPKWIYDKIYAVWSGYLEVQSITMRADDWTGQDVGIALQKTSDNTMFFLCVNGADITLTADRGFRVAFDLIIDNE